MLKQKNGKTPPASNGHRDQHAISARRPNAGTKARAHLHETFHGVLEEFNLSPKGGIEGFLLHADGQTVQVNVSPEVGFAVVRGIGQTVAATVDPDLESRKHGKGDHPVYSLVALTGSDGNGLIFASGDGADLVTVEGTIKANQLCPPRGRNGVVLDSGDFIYMKPEGMRKVALKIGDHVTGGRDSRDDAAGPAGHRGKDRQWRRGGWPRNRPGHVTIGYGKAFARIAARLKIFNGVRDVPSPRESLR